jgi:hypothetical protein
MACRVDGRRIAPQGQAGGKRTIDVSGFWGKAPGLKLAPREDFEERSHTIAARDAAR